MKDYYKILDVPKTASQEEIKKVYRKLAFQFHPDRNSDLAASLRMKEINEAYDILGDELKRQKYNSKLEYRAVYEAQYQNRPYTSKANPPRQQARAFYQRNRNLVREYDLSGWAGIAKFIAGFIILYCGLLIFDYFISQSFNKIIVNHFTAYPQSGKYNIYEIESDHLDFTLASFGSINSGDTLSLRISPFFGIVSECTEYSYGFETSAPLRTIYSPMILIVLLALGLGIGALLSKAHQEIVSMTIASAFFFIIVLNMMY